MSCYRIEGCILYILLGVELSRVAYASVYYETLAEFLVTSDASNYVLKTPKIA